MRVELLVELCQHEKIVLDKRRRDAAIVIKILFKELIAGHWNGPAVHERLQTELIGVVAPRNKRSTRVKEKDAILKLWAPTTQAVAPVANSATRRPRPRAKTAGIIDRRNRLGKQMMASSVFLNWRF